MITLRLLLVWILSTGERHWKETHGKKRICAYILWLYFACFLLLILKNQFWSLLFKICIYVSGTSAMLCHMEIAQWSSQGL